MCACGAMFALRHAIVFVFLVVLALAHFQKTMTFFDPIETDHEISGLSFSREWLVLGPLRIGTRGKHVRSLSRR
jgi:hypothetical protein